MTHTKQTSADRPGLDELINAAIAFLPAQGPISSYVFYNTLQALEHLPFDEAVRQGAALYRCEPYLSEYRYHKELRSGRITVEDLNSVLLDDLGAQADQFVGFMGTRFHLRLAMLEHPLRVGTEHELRWLISDTDALRKFRPEATPEARSQLIAETRLWVERDLSNGGTHIDSWTRQHVQSVLAEHGFPGSDSWTDSTWESVTLQCLWGICLHAAQKMAPPCRSEPCPVRHHDLLHRVTGRSTDDLVHASLIRFCAGFLDQGLASWSLPQRDQGFWKSFVALYGSGRGKHPWHHRLASELQRIQREELTVDQTIEQLLSQFGVEAAERQEFLTKTLLALRGWAGMIWQMETNAEWAVRPAATGTLKEYLAARLLLDRLALEWLYADLTGQDLSAAHIREQLRKRFPLSSSQHHEHHEQQAYLLFQLAQIRGWSPKDLAHMSPAAWAVLFSEIDAFDDVERKRIYHQAYERRYCTQILDSLAAQLRWKARQPARPATRPTWQLVTCIDDREESFRRHLEEVDPCGETYSAAGFFAVAMYFKSAADAHFKPLCPAVMKPSHYVTEQPAYSLTESARSRRDARRLLGNASHQWHMSSRSFLGGMVTAALGSLATAPLVARVLFPRLTSRLRRTFGGFVQPPAVTELQLLRDEEPPGPEGNHLGYTRDEMAGIVLRILQDIGLTQNFSRIVMIVGHGSSSVNNPHESSYHCGACGCARGGPNARAFAQMANDPHIRKRLADNGLFIPDDTVFVGAYHNTCNEDVDYFDLNAIPRSHRPQFEEVRRVIDAARLRNAHERCRRFQSAPLSITPEQALEHVQTRAEDLSQPRPEYDHATNAIQVIGRRSLTRSLYLDRRAFVTSYDPTTDDEDGSILARISGAAIPVCTGINLQFLFSTIDPVGYGCGSKLPHNIASLLGVMEGAASDLRPWLYSQVVEIHEPMRMVTIVEQTPEVMLKVMAGNAAINQLVRNNWTYLVTIDPLTAEMHLFQNGEFRPYRPGDIELPERSSSMEWYRGRRDNLPCARIPAIAVSSTVETEVA